MSVAHAPAVFGRRACALLAACSAVLHVFMLGHAGNLMAGGLLAAMIIGCLYCAHDLWKRGTPAGWCTVALMNLAMVALHTPMPAHHHHGSRQGAGSGQPTLMMLAVLLALAEATIAAVVLYCCTRKRSVIPLPSQGM